MVADPYRVWVSEIMLQQTQIKTVIPAYARFMELFPTIEDLARANTDNIKSVCKGLGYYRRFDLLHKAAKVVVFQNGSRWPNSFTEWLELPGIGQYTAAALASIINGEPVVALDGNVERVLCRIYDLRIIANENKKLLTGLAQGFAHITCPGIFNQAFMQLGQLLCTPTNPRCSSCPVMEFCTSLKANSQQLAPAKKPPQKMLTVNMKILICTNSEGQVCLTTRHSGAKFLKNTLGFKTGIQAENKLFEDGGEPLILEGMRIGTFKHAITKHKLAIEVFHRNSNQLEAKRETWYAPVKVPQMLTTSFDQKAWEIYKESHGDQFH